MNPSRKSATPPSGSCSPVVVRPVRTRGVLGLGVAMSLGLAWMSGLAAPPAFVPHADGGYSFDSGVLRGRLRAGGKSLGLQEVAYVASGQRLDTSNGLLSHYRVFASGRRYGGGAWDWPSRARLEADGSVEVTWLSEADRPFELRARYRWCDPASIEVTTSVKAVESLKGFESFLASYFDSSFTNALVHVAGADGPRWVAAEPAAGAWQLFPRDAAAVGLARDGRWALDPHPVDWTVREPFAQPLVRRRAPASGLSALLMAPAAECFAVSLPHQFEGHYSAYLSLFGRDLAPGETAEARVRLMVVVAKPDRAVLALYQSAAKEWTARSE